MRSHALSLATLLLLCALPALAQPARPSDPRDTRCVLRVKGMERAVERNDLVYRTAADSVRGFDLFLPPGATSAKPVPVVIFFNGGSGNSPPQRKWGIYRDWARLATTRGLAAMVPDAASGHGTAEMGAALEHLRANAAKYGIDPDRVAIWGCSMHVREGLPFAMDPVRRIRAVVMYYGFTDTAAMDPDKPMLLARAGLDMAAMNQSMAAWATKAVRLGAPLTWIDLPSLHHAFEDNALSRSVVATTLDFLEQELSPEVIRDRAAYSEERSTRRLSAARDWPAALRAAESWVAVAPSDGGATSALADALYQTRDFARAASEFERAAQLGGQQGVLRYNAACCRALLGEKDRALTLLEQAADGFQGDRSSWARDPDLVSLLGEPRFKAILAGK